MFWSDIKLAVREGTLLAVKYGVMLMVLLAIVLYALGDYTATRQRAEYAFTFIQRVEAQQKAQQTPTPGAKP